jgi:hypothetical protein
MSEGVVKGVKLGFALDLSPHECPRGGGASRETAQKW